MNEESKEIVQAKTIAFRLLKIRSRSENEIRERLKQKHISSATIDHTVVVLKNTRLIDDQQFTKDWIQARLNRPFGLRRIHVELIKKGINKEIIKEEFAQIKTYYQESEIVETLAKRRAARYANIDRQKRKKRVFDYLARRGFSLDAIQKAIQTL